MKISPHARGGFYTTLTVNGKKNFIYGATPDEVDAKYTEMKYKHHRGYNVNENPTLEQYMIRWYGAYKKGEGALKTQEMYQNCINNHINPILGSKKVKEVTSTDVQTLIKGITSSKSLAHKVRITLNQIFKVAVADKIIDFNPVSNTKIIAPDKPKRKHLSQAQRDILLKILKGHRIYPLVYTMLYTGTRRGEALALTWNDIDLDSRIVKVTKATEYKESKPKQKPPKTKKGIRNIPMPPELTKFLKAQKKKSKSIYVFPGHAGGPMGMSELNKQWRIAKNKIEKWFEANEKKGLEKKVDIEEFNLTCRLLRHTYCTGLYDAGIDEVSAAELMGHDVGIMREVYTHISEERKIDTIAKIDTLYKATKSSGKTVKVVK